MKRPPKLPALVVSGWLSLAGPPGERSLGLRFALRSARHSGFECGSLVLGRGVPVGASWARGGAFSGLAGNRWSGGAGVDVAEHPCAALQARGSARVCGHLGLGRGAPVGASCARGGALSGLAGNRRSGGAGADGAEHPRVALQTRRSASVCGHLVLGRGAPVRASCARGGAFCELAGNRRTGGAGADVAGHPHVALQACRSASVCGDLVRGRGAPVGASCARGGACSGLAANRRTGGTGGDVAEHPRVALQARGSASMCGHLGLERGAPVGASCARGGACSGLAGNVGRAAPAGT